MKYIDTHTYGDVMRTTDPLPHQDADVSVCKENVETYTYDDEHVHAINMAGCLA